MPPKFKYKPRWPWLLWALWNPVDACDLYDQHQNPDHEKIVPFLFLVFACVMHALGHGLAWYAIVSLGSLSIGWPAWRLFLKSKTVSGTFRDSTETKTLTETKTVRVERDPEAGVDPT